MRIIRAGLVVLFLLAGPAAAAGAEDFIRPSVLAGTWYPAEAEELARSVEGFLAGGPKEQPPGRVLALVVPHAGHLYSGAVAGAAWGLAARLSPPPRTVVLLGPSHRFPLTKPSLWPQGAYTCPLGRAPVDADLAGRLGRRLEADFVRPAHLSEHCLEIQVPFLIKALPQARLVAVLTGRPDLARARLMGQALAEETAGRPVLLVASTDLSHFHPEEEAWRLDDRVAERIEKLDPEGLLEDASQGKAEACGLQALMAVMFAARQMGAERGLILDRATSAKVTGDRRQVVGYLAAALVGPNAPEKASAGPLELSPEQKRSIKDLARRSVEAAVQGRDLPAPPADDPLLARSGRVFVTLRRHDRLRGCIGTLSPRLPLGRAVVEMAALAALRDPRFEAVRPSELEDLQLEISLLSPPQPARPEEVQVGRDGLIIELNGRSGLLLPQVPGEMNWDREQFLDGLCRKAGLPPGAWRQPEARLERFEALVF